MRGALSFSFSWPLLVLMGVACGSKDPATPTNNGTASSSSASSSSGGGGGAGGNGATSGADVPAEKKLAAIKSLEEAFSSRDVKKFSSLLTDDATSNVAGRPDTHGRASAEQGFTRVTALFGSKLKYRARRVFTKGDAAIVEWTMTGTHEAAMHGVEPTHKAIGIQGAEVDRFAADGRIRERHLYFDQATTLGQIGKPVESGF